MFNFNVNSINFLRDRNNCYYLYYILPNELRFGDFVFLTTILFFIKIYIIRQSKGKFNINNLFFLPHFKLDQEYFIDDFDNLLNYFPNVQRYNKGNSYIKKYSTHQFFKHMNLQYLKEYIEFYNIKLDNPLTQYHTKHNIVDVHYKFKHKLKNINKQDVYIFPVVNKKYNIERNMNTTNIYNFIKHINVKYRNIIIINKDDMCKNNIDLKYLQNEFDNVKIYGINETQDNIILNIIINCKLFISGDCGLSHFIALLPNEFRPWMFLYYKTQCNNVDNGTIKTTAKLMNLNLKLKQITFKPYCPYQKSNMLISSYF